jgi:tetratricopeptide (TPR) repeat protein
MKRLTQLILLAALAASASAQSGAGAQLAQANGALQAGEADKALALLLPLTQPNGTATAFNLKCRVEYSIEHWDQAAEDCEQAVKLDGQISDNHLWLARALGAKASRASFLSAFKLAKQVHAEFEEAVRLNPRNTEALADLGEFDYTAPAVVGGGIDKAGGVAAQLEKIDPVRAHELRGRIAEHKKDYATAEQEYKLTISTAAHPAFQWITLARFYQGRERWDEMEAAVRSGQSAAEHDKHANVALYDGAELLILTKRDSARAAKMLEKYLAGSMKSEAAPAFVAHTWLARLKRLSGDKAAALQERAAALALAHDYKPALDLKLI